MSAATSITPPTVINDQTQVVRDRHFSIDAGDESVLATLAHLQRERVTGQLIVDLTQGGMCSIRFREQRKVEFDKNNP